MIDRFEIAGGKLLRRLIDFLLLAIDHLLYFHRLLHRAIEPIDTGHVRAVIELQRRIVVQKLCDGRRMFIVDQKRGLL